MGKGIHIQGYSHPWILLIPFPPPLIMYFLIFMFTQFHLLIGDHA